MVQHIYFGDGGLTAGPKSRSPCVVPPPSVVQHIYFWDGGLTAGAKSRSPCVVPEVLLVQHKVYQHQTIELIEFIELFDSHAVIQLGKYYESDRASA